MESYERGFAGEPELSILFLMGLFDRPAKQDVIRTLLRVNPPIRNLTTALCDLDHSKWKIALHNLRDRCLLSSEEENSPDHREAPLDCHPLVRDHFGRKLKEEHPEAWKEAHLRLYEYYKDLPEKELPGTLGEMEPLFAAVTHGCHAGLHGEVLENIYINRICRGEKDFLKDTLTAIGTELSLISNFFEKYWYSVLNSVEDKALQGLLLRDAGLDLRFLGRLKDSEKSFDSAIRQYESIGNDKMATNSVRHLIQLYICMGSIKKAEKLRDIAEALASKLPACFEKASAITTSADVLHQTGEFEKAKKKFKEAEEALKKSGSKSRHLERLAGYRYWDLLLSLGEFDKVIDRCQSNMTPENRKKYRLGYALAFLARGQARLYKSRREKTNDFNDAENDLNKAMEVLREAGQLEFIVRGLFARADFYRILNDYSMAWADLEEAREIVMQSGMKTHKADYHLGIARLNLARNRRGEAGDSLKKAEKMIHENGYGRRRREIDKLKEAIGGT